MFRCLKIQCQLGLYIVLKPSPRYLKVEFLNVCRCLKFFIAISNGRRQGEGNLADREKKNFCYRAKRCQLLLVMPAFLLVSSPQSSCDHSVPPVYVAACSEVTPCTLHHQTGTHSFMHFIGCPLATLQAMFAGLFSLWAASSVLMSQCKQLPATERKPTCALSGGGKIPQNLACIYLI